MQAERTILASMNLTYEVSTILSFGSRPDIDFKPIAIEVPLMYNDGDYMRFIASATNTIEEACGRASCIGELDVDQARPVDLPIVVRSANIQCASSRCPLLEYRDAGSTEVQLEFQTEPTPTAQELPDLV